MYTTNIEIFVSVEARGGKAATCDFNQNVIF